MKLKPYLEAIQATKEDNEKALAPARANQTKAALGMRIAQLSIDIQNAELAVSGTAQRHPLNIDSVVIELDKLALLSRQRDQLVEIEKQLFPA